MEATGKFSLRRRAGKLCNSMTHKHIQCIDNNSLKFYDTFYKPKKNKHL
jgi:predicted component of type VI protein secretion system